MMGKGVVVFLIHSLTIHKGLIIMQIFPFALNLKKKKKTMTREKPRPRRGTGSSFRRAFVSS